MRHVSPAMSDATTPATAAPAPVSMDNLVALAKRRGFIFQSSEIYGGFNGFFDYGPLGAELKKNIRDCWWADMVQSAAVRGIKVQTSLSKKKDAVLTIVNTDAAASIVEFAGTNPNRLAEALNGWGNKPRVMWRAYENNAGAVEAEMKQSVDKVMAEINQLTKALVL